MCHFLAHPVYWRYKRDMIETFKILHSDYDRLTAVAPDLPTSICQDSVTRGNRSSCRLVKNCSRYDIQNTFHSKDSYYME